VTIAMMIGLSLGGCTPVRPPSYGKWTTKNCYNLEKLQLQCHKQLLEMTKTELLVAIAAASETNKTIAGVFLDTLCGLAYKAVKKYDEFVVPGFGKSRQIL
jgi:hypothetical protein